MLAPNPMRTHLTLLGLLALAATPWAAPAPALSAEQVRVALRSQPSDARRLRRRVSRRRLNLRSTHPVACMLVIQASGSSAHRAAWLCLGRAPPLAPSPPLLRPASPPPQAAALEGVWVLESGDRLYGVHYDELLKEAAANETVDAQAMLQAAMDVKPGPSECPDRPCRARRVFAARSRLPAWPTVQRSRSLFPPSTPRRVRPAA